MRPYRPLGKKQEARRWGRINRLHKEGTCPCMGPNEEAERRDRHRRRLKKKQRHERWEW